VNGYRIIDADCHVIEPDLWRSSGDAAILASPLFDRASQLSQITDHMSPEVLSRMPPTVVRELLRYDISAYDAASQAKAIRVLGAEMAFLYPSIGLLLFAVDEMDAHVAGAAVRIYNNWLRDFCSHDPAVLRGVGVVNRHAPEEMVPELRRIHGFGWKAVLIRPNPIKGRTLSHPDYEPFWSECERLDVAVGIHEGTYARVPTLGADRFESHFARHTSSHPMEHMAALLTLIDGGVLERHPRLRVAFLESGGGWLPYWLWRMDRTYQGVGKQQVAENVTMPPSDYFRRQCYIAVEPDEPYLGALIDFLGTDRVVIGSDFPHHDHDPDVMKDAVALEGRLPKTAVRKLLWDNPARLYGVADA
jgi:predicted TIM-barrel fold metal-dependent hydrolase